MGNRPLEEIKPILKLKKITCLCCGKEDYIDNYYGSDSLQYRAYCKIPYCKECICKMYQGYVDEFTEKQYTSPDRRAAQRLSMVLDLYYSDRIFDSAEKEYNKDLGRYEGSDLKFITYFIKHSKMYQYRKRNYNSTLDENLKDISNKQGIPMVSPVDIDEQEEIAKAKKIFGAGFANTDYLFLLEQYNDWTSRHECTTKSQEEIFKALCFNRLKAHKANINGDDTKDLDKTFKDLLDTGKLQPKQNKGETVSDSQTFGTLIEEWENHDPIPEVDEELKDVDKIGLFLDVFFRGHLAKFMGLKNGVSKYYEEYMKRFTVTKPSKKLDSDDEESMDDSEVIFDTLFGNVVSDKEE